MLNANQILRLGFGLVRGVTREAKRLGRGAVSTATATVQRVRHVRPAPKDLDDATLARKVETELFRTEHSLKGTVDVNAVDGVVELRGEVRRPEEIAELETRVRAIPEVVSVENLLHVPKTPPQPRAGRAKRARASSSTPRRTASTDAPKRARRATRATPKPTRTTARRAPGKVSDDKTTRLVDQAEPTGEQARAKGTGRQPAPLGSRGNGGEPTTGASGEAATETGAGAAARTPKGGTGAS